MEGRATPYIKSLPIHYSVRARLLYIMNPEKTAERTLVTGLNLETDVDIAMQQLAMTYRVQSIPTLMLFKGGKPVSAMVGARPKAAIMEMLK